MPKLTIRASCTDNRKAWLSKNFIFQKIFRQETSGGTLKEDVFIVDGMKIKLQVSVEFVRAQLIY